MRRTEGMARLEDCPLEQALAGEERVAVRGDEVVAQRPHYDTGCWIQSVG